MVNLEVFIVEAASVNALTTSTVTVSEVSSLDHEVRDDTMEDRALITEAGGTSAELLKVLDRLGDSLSVKTHHNATGGLSSNLCSIAKQSIHLVSQKVSRNSGIEGSKVGFPFAERMTWSKMRRTNVEEDLISHLRALLSRIVATNTVSLVT